MLDGRVLEASQVEYKPFGKPPLQRELPWPNSSLTAPTTWGSRARSCSTWGHARQKMLWLKCSKAFQHGWLATANM